MCKKLIDLAWTSSSHNLDQCWHIVSWTIWNKLQWKLNQNTISFIKGSAFENAVCKMGSFCLRLNVLKSVQIHQQLTCDDVINTRNSNGTLPARNQATNNPRESCVWCNIRNIFQISVMKQCNTMKHMTKRCNSFSLLTHKSNVNL